ncbi:hypothetical protein [Streptomyces xantholiticus]|nr:hypothetical protein [Streptomyces xantholiticus]
MPQLILAGHTAPEAEKWATLIPAYEQVSSQAVSAFASALTT